VRTICALQRSHRGRQAVLNRRSWMTGVAAFSIVRSAKAAEPLEIFTSDVRPLAIAEGLRRGIVLDILGDAVRSVGREFRTAFLPFADALREVQARPGSLMTPLARSAQRERDFAWISKIIDVPQAMGCLSGRPPVDLEGARGLARVGVVRGGVQEGFLRDKGFANLVAFATARELAKALADGEVDAWYSTATEISLQFEAIGQANRVRIGPMIQEVPVWLAGNTQTEDVPVDRIRFAVEKLQTSGSIERIYRSYVAS
jgi:polar amino acid transport system substrate-binding protein